MSEIEDNEMQKAFIAEIESIKSELKPIVEIIKKNPQSSADSFEKFGQIIDRIFGTAATLGHKELAEYCKSMKTICYKCSQSKNAYAQGKVKEFIVVCMSQMEQFQKGILDPKEMRKIRILLMTEHEKITSLQKSAFREIKKSSVSS